MDDTLKTIVKHIESRRETFVERLREAVEIRSVSGWPDHRDDVIKMVKWTAQHLRFMHVFLKREMMKSEKTERNGEK